MLKCFLLTKKYLLIVAICVSSYAINGCVDSINYLASDSRLPKWFTLPPGLTRADVMVVRYSMEPTQRKPILLGYFDIDVVNGVPEITGYKAQIDEHGNRMPYFYVVDDPALKRKLLDENEKELLDDNGVDYPDLRKKLLDENGGPFLPIKSGWLRSAFRQAQCSRASRDDVAPDIRVIRLPLAGVVMLADD